MVFPSKHGDHRFWPIPKKVHTCFHKFSTMVSSPWNDSGYFLELQLSWLGNKCVSGGLTLLDKRTNGGGREKRERPRHINCDIIIHIFCYIHSWFLLYIYIYIYTYIYIYIYVCVSKHAQKYAWMLWKQMLPQKSSRPAMLWAGDAAINPKPFEGHPAAQPQSCHIRLPLFGNAKKLPRRWHERPRNLPSGND